MDVTNICQINSGGIFSWIIYMIFCNISEVLYLPAVTSLRTDYDKTVMANFN